MALAGFPLPQEPVLDAYTEHGVQVLILYGDADHAHRAALEAAFTAVGATGRRLVVDVTQLTYADETLHGLLLTARTRARLVLAGTLPPVLRQRIAVAGTQRFLPTAPDTATAIALLRSTS
ncbi:STAS domain-containing protein [Streptomyces zhihengii]|uniref:STAS domain-containing protein n=1 Tax=Streptomyces zhihengii TaxID=1818004 RepID=A0ABS2V2Z2_9ACTN|nr:STAS domain-containing protein [Streptomyces zhihengii]MBM9624191.1 STAS domain-containing protein [Streptomyces zhihengii]